MFGFQTKILARGLVSAISNLTKEIRMTFTQSISKFHREESGQDLVEYALVLVAVAAAVFAGNQTLATNFAGWMTNLKAKIDTYLT